jgi:SPP1 gp7 family putative phage head morphogenesis protein
MLTIRKQKWIKQRKVEAIRGRVINPSAAVQARYHKDLEAVITQMIEETEREISKLFKSEAAENFFVEDASIASQAKLITNALFEKFGKLFDLKSKPMAKKFAKQADRASSVAVHSSLKELSGGLSLGTRKLDPDTREILKATIEENVGLIKSIPQKYLGEVQGAVMRSITSKNGMNDLIPALQKYKGITYRRARFIAADQTRKANSALSNGRLQKLGIEEFEWVHTASPHPRHLHEKLDGKIFRFDDPPVIQKDPEIKGLPAQLPGCRCRALPVFKFGD